jgi:outer membrane protein TolC
VLIVALAAGAAQAEPVTLQRAVELAIARAAQTGVATANQAKARATYREARSPFLPQVGVGSGLGASYGYPLSIEGAAPSIFNINYQSFLYNAAQREMMRSAQAGVEAAEASAEGARRDAVLETTVSYVQLNAIVARLSTIQGQLQQAASLVVVVEARVEEGVEAKQELTRARLVEAQARMTLADAHGAAAVLRQRLSQLTGIPAEGLETIPESIREVPDAARENELLAKALAASTAVRTAEHEARSKQLRAQGEHKLMYPSVDVAAQYGLFSRYNNYDDFFQRFQRNNATVGLVIRFPFLNSLQRAAAESADADAVLARRQAEATRNQVSTETLELARAAQQLAAAEEVARLQYELAQAQVEATEARMESAAPPVAGGAPVSPRDLLLARIEAGRLYSSVLDTGFELQKTRLQLLRAVGRLEAWATGRN